MSPINSIGKEEKSYGRYSRLLRTREKQALHGQIAHLGSRRLSCRCDVKPANPNTYNGLTTRFVGNLLKGSVPDGKLGSYFYFFIRGGKSFKDLLTIFLISLSSFLRAFCGSCHLFVAVPCQITTLDLQSRA